MKIILCICQDRYVNEIVQVLNERGLRSTKLDSSGGFFRKGSTTLLIGIHAEIKDKVVSLIEETCDKMDQNKSERASKVEKDRRMNRVTLFVLDAFTAKDVNATVDI